MRTDEDLLRAALLGYEQQLQTISGKMEVIRQELRGRTVSEISGEAAAPKGKKRTMSAAGREAIRQAQIARWKKQKKTMTAA